MHVLIDGVVHTVGRSHELLLLIGASVVMPAESLIIRHFRKPGHLERFMQVFDRTFSSPNRNVE